MASARGRIDRATLLERLAPIEYAPDDEEERPFDRASMARALLHLVDVNQEAEFLLCQRVAQHLLGRVPEPDDVEL